MSFYNFLLNYPIFIIDYASIDNEMHSSPTLPPLNFELFNSRSQKLNFNFQSSLNSVFNKNSLTFNMTPTDCFSKSFNNTMKMPTLNSFNTTLLSMSPTSAISTLGAKGTRNRSSNGTVGENIVTTARKYLGYNEQDGSADMFWREIGKSLSNYKYYQGWKSKTSEWCAAFVAYVLINNGVDMSDCEGPGWVPSLKKWGEKHNKYVSSRNASPSNIKPGDVVLYPNKKYNPNQPDSYTNYEFRHTGIVTKVYPNGTFDTIEGNSGGGRVCSHKGLKLSNFCFIQTA